MKFMSKLQKKRDELKKDNNGFSLVELIIVIAIMAILVGIVGTQVIPYINKSREAKDGQIVSSYSTAAVTAYSSTAAKLTYPTTAGAFLVYGNNGKANTEADPVQTLAKEITDLTYDTSTNLKNKFKSTNGKKIENIKIEYNLDNKVITAQAVDANKLDANKVLDPAVSDL